MGEGEFHIPIGLAINGFHDLFVTDFYNGRVQRFTREGEFVSAFAVLPNPGPVALDSAGKLYVTHFTAMRPDEERKPDRVAVYDVEGRLLREWGRSGTGQGEFDYPGGIAVSRDGRVYVADQTNHRVQVFDLEGRFLAQWGEFGVERGQFGGCGPQNSRVAGPNFLALDAEGNLFTTEAAMGRIQKFTAGGEYLLSWGSLGTEPGGFGGGFEGFGNGPASIQGPVGICVDARGDVWISSINGRLQQFDATGTYLRGLALGQGTEPGQFLAPHAVALDSRGDLYVVDSFNHRVQKFRVAG